MFRAFATHHQEVFCIYTTVGMASWNMTTHAQKPDFVFRRNRRVHLTLYLLMWGIWWAPNNASRWQMGFNWLFKGLNRRGASVQSTTGSRGVRISGSNAGYTMFRGSVKGTGYPLHSPVSPSLPLPCVTVCHHISTELYENFNWRRCLSSLRPTAMRHLAKQKVYILAAEEFFLLFVTKDPTYSCRISKTDHIHLSYLRCEHHLNSAPSLPPDSVMHRLPNAYIFSTLGSHRRQHNPTNCGAWECTFEVTAVVKKIAVIYNI